MLFLDVKYASLLGVHLRNFKKKGDYLWNFSCPICGDSKKKTTKARGYIFRYKDGLLYKCHNCDASISLRNFLRVLNENLYNDYTVELFKENHPDPAKPKPKAAPKPLQPKIQLTEEVVDTVLDGATRLDRLAEDHPARLYIVNRKLPASALKLLYYVPRFKKFVNTVLPGKYDPVVADHPRLIIPYFNQHGAVYTFQGRAFGAEEPRYTTIKVVPESSRIFGLERIDALQRVFAVEGPLDALCLPNAIAVSGSSFGSPTLELIRSNLTVVFDNEPRSTEITRLIRRIIKRGFAVCIWPDTIQEKDINDMILSGKTAGSIVEMINANTFQGAAAALRFSQWCKTETPRQYKRGRS